MIVVIADDITGAAEMGGIALRYGLDVLIVDDLKHRGNHDVAIVYTNTRSASENEAAETMGRLTAEAMQLEPSLFYKKTDSVLRGHIVAEMQQQMNAMNVERGLLVPINPSSGRIIKNGKYYINNVPVNETSFSVDPEFPILTSSVEQMLVKSKGIVEVKKKDEAPEAAGITLGEAETTGDLMRWATRSDTSMLLAGGGSFFNALMQLKYKPRQKIKKPKVKLYSPLCLVSGTTFRKNVERINNHASLVSYMPKEIFSAPGIDVQYDSWLNEAHEILEKKGKVIVAVNNLEQVKVDPQILSGKLAEFMKQFVHKTQISDLLIEGGATAYSIVKEIGWHSFLPTEEMEQGIVRMQVVENPDLHLTIKPGSNEWPREWNFN